VTPSKRINALSRSRNISPSTKCAMAKDSLETEDVRAIVKVFNISITFFVKTGIRGKDKKTLTIAHPFIPIIV
jgi:hypothetical protein